MDRELADEYKGTRTEDVDLSHTTYELDYAKESSAYNDKLRVLNITDAPLMVLGLALSYGNETLGSIHARLATSEQAQLSWAMNEAIERGGSGVLHPVVPRSDLTLTPVSEVLLVVTRVDGDTVRVLDARHVSSAEKMVLAVLPGLLEEESGEPVNVQPGHLMETIVEELLDGMGETRWALAMCFCEYFVRSRSIGHVKPTVQVHNTLVNDVV